jgi:hypothetical protein
MSDYVGGFRDGDRVHHGGIGEDGTVDPTIRDGQGAFGDDYVPVRLDHGVEAGYLPSVLTLISRPPEGCIPERQAHEFHRIINWVREQDGCSGIVMRPAASYDYDFAESYGQRCVDTAAEDWYIETVAWPDAETEAHTCCTIISKDGEVIANWEVQ